MNIKNTIFSLTIVSGAALVSGNVSAAVISDAICGSGSYTVVPNGGLETGTTGWSNPFPRGSWAASTEEACVGNSSAKSVPSQNFTGPGFAMQRSVSGLIAGDQYVLSGFFNVEGVANAEVYIDLNDFSPSEPNLFNGSGHQGESGWFFAHETFTANATSMTVRLVMDLDVVTTDVAYIDEVAITPLAQFQTAQIQTSQSTTSIPEPGALALFGIGIAGLGFVRARRRIGR